VGEGKEGLTLHFSPPAQSSAAVYNGVRKDWLSDSHQQIVPDSSPYDKEILTLVFWWHKHKSTGEIEYAYHSIVAYHSWTNPPFSVNPNLCYTFVFYFLLRVHFLPSYLYTLKSVNLKREYYVHEKVNLCELWNKKIYVSTKKDNCGELIPIWPLSQRGMLNPINLPYKIQPMSAGWPARINNQQL